MVWRLSAVVLFLSLLVVAGSAAERHPASGLRAGHGRTAAVASRLGHNGSAQAQATDTWLGGLHNWSESQYWSLNRPPQASDDVVIYSGTTDDGVGFDVGSATVNSLVIGGDSPQYFSGIWDQAITQSLAVNNGLTIGASGYLIMNGSESGLTLSGATPSTNAGSLDFEGGVFTNKSTLYNLGSGGIYNSGQLINQGTLSNNGPLSYITNQGLIINSYLISNSASFYDYGYLTNKAGSDIVNLTGAFFEVYGGLYNSGAIVNTGEFDLYGSLTNAYTGVIANGAGTFYSEGTLTSFGVITNGASTTFDNYGALQLVSMNLPSTFTNSGNVINESTGTIYLAGAKFTNAPGSTLTNSGNIVIATGSSMLNVGSAAFAQSAGSTVVDGSLTSATTVQVSGGTMGGLGSVTGNVLLGGTLSPGDPAGKSTGVFTINGNYTQSSSGTFYAEIAGTAFGDQYDTLVVNGVVSLDGTLSVALLNNFTVQIGEQFELMTFNSGTGTFSALNLPSLPSGEKWQVVYDATDVTLKVIAASGEVATPEPGTMVLMGTGLLGLAGLVRNRTKR